MHERQAPYIITAVIAGIVGALMVVAAVRFTGLGSALVTPAPVEPVPQSAQQVQIKQQPTVQDHWPSLNEYEKTTIDVVRQVSPSVVMITTNTVVEDFDFFSGPEVRNIQGLGSGVIYRNDGYLLTNNHVISGLKGAADRILVVLGDGKSYAAKVVGADPLTDLAVLKINHNNLPVPKWANSDKVQEGQVAIAIGNPLAENLKNTVTVGVVSAKGRTVKVNNDFEMRNLIQTDASINAGNSGGPLLDSKGNIIGINTLIVANSQGIGLAIPSNTAKTVADQLISKGYVSRPGLGIGYFILTPENVRVLEYRLQRNLPTENGILIVRVTKNTPAHLAGLLPGDIIVKINGQALENDDFREVIGKYKVGTKLKLDYYRGSELKQATVTVGEARP